MPTLQNVEVNSRKWNQTWQKRDFDILKEQGLLVGYPDGLVYHWNDMPTRFECAVAVKATAKHISDILDGISAEVALSGGISPQLVQEVQGISEWPIDIEIWADLAREYSPELRKLGAEVSTKDLKGQMVDKMKGLIPTIPQFADVPETHWAAKDILELRRRGILDGFPSKKPGNAHRQNTFN